MAVCGEKLALEGLGPLMSAGKDKLLLLVVLFIANYVGGDETRSVGAM